ncbi:MAG TPA: MoxR family ATPase [Chloroflexaceae bacterium]|nr:MoxR family ATPase [Chloroflexaceae bacterium]
MTVSVQQIYAAVRPEIVGRERELTGILAAIGAGRDVLLEGPPGIGKSTILRAITRHYGIPLVLVEGNADLTPAKLIGYHNPAQVVRHGYRAEDFVPGPLPDAMQRGGFLYIEEFNRVPEDTLNTLLTAMAEREITIPRVGTLRALPTFHIVASMNPFDNVGTARISVSIYDRLCRLAMFYQSEEEERAIVRLRTRSELPRLVELAVAITRATRAHPEARLGSSVRGAIDLVLVAQQLAAIREVDLSAPGGVEAVLAEAANLALSSKISLHETNERPPEAVIAEILGQIAPRADQMTAA